MAKISEIMLLQQPEQPALAIEVQTDMKGMSQAIGENFVRIDSVSYTHLRAHETS